MEIKKGISQMAEYPNAEVNYVVPADGQMYYVLKDGALANGCVIATLDPKRAVDPGVLCDSIGVFKEDGTVLIDFDKKDIRPISDNFLLVVNSIPKSEEVVNALKNMDDEISKTMLKDNSTTIVDKMMIEMGITGEILFSDAYSEANIYMMDSENHKIGPDVSFIGKNDNSFYFHTNDSTTEAVLISLTGEVINSEPTGFTMPEEPIENNVPQEEVTETVEVPVEEPAAEEPTEVEMPEETVEEEIQATDFSMDDIEESDLKLDISQNILDGFKPMEEPEMNTEMPEETSTDVEETSFELPVEEPTVETEEETTEESVEEEKDEVLDNVIEVMKKMIEETNKLNEKIAELEKEIEEKNEFISSQETKISEQEDKIAEQEAKISAQESKIASEESKKNELSDLLSEANEVLENID
ncbi:MAG: hypothetical protein J6C46_08200 [Clostridia bacterium]|nr:hypothetical protein [Clostridia bacterium]